MCSCCKSSCLPFNPSADSSSLVYSMRASRDERVVLFSFSDSVQFRRFCDVNCDYCSSRRSEVNIPSKYCPSPEADYVVPSRWYDTCAVVLFFASQVGRLHLRLSESAICLRVCVCRWGNATSFRETRLQGKKTPKEDGGDTDGEVCQANELPVLSVRRGVFPPEWSHRCSPFHLLSHLAALLSLF